jgi:hypothetical protein
MARAKKQYENKWNFKGEALDAIPDKAVGFVYVITDLENGKRYIGKKSFWSKRKLKPTDKRRTTVESDWKHYYSSSEKIKELIKAHGVTRFRRDIIAVCTHDKYVNYLEIKYQMLFGVIENADMWYNDNINGLWYPYNYKTFDAETDIDINILDA